MPKKPLCGRKLGVAPNLACLSLQERENAECLRLPAKRHGMNPENDELQAQWILRSNWLQASVLHHARAQKPPQSPLDLCEFLFQRGMLSSEQVQQIRYAAQVQTQGAPRPSPRLSDRLRQDLSPDSQERLAGRLIGQGQFRIIEEISRGGMGVVYRGEQIATKRAVAIKFILSSQSDEPTLERFRREIDALKTLQHPNIAAVLGHGLEGDQPFFVMDFIEGMNFEDFIEDQIRAGSAHPDPTKSTKILGAVARALEYTHQNSFIHRDVKPPNILISKAEQRAFLVDFGLVKEDKPANSGALRLSKSGELIGTLDFMSPEQLDSGAFGRHSSATDVWSFGATMYFALTGMKAFTAKNHTELLAQVLHTRPKAPAKINSQVPPWLNQLCLDCLQLNPEDRPSINDVSQAFRDEEWRSEQHSGGLQSLLKNPVLPLSFLFLFLALGTFTLAFFLASSSNSTLPPPRSTDDSAQILAQLRSGDIRETLAGLNRLKDWRGSESAQKDFDAQLLYLLEHKEDLIRIESLKVLREQGNATPNIIQSTFHQFTHKNPQVANEAVKNLVRLGPKVSKALGERLQSMNEPGQSYVLNVLDALSRADKSILLIHKDSLRPLLSSDNSKVCEHAAQLLARSLGLTATDFAKRGKERLDEEDYKAAEFDLQLATLLQEDIEEGLANLARAQIQLKKYSEALKVLTRARIVNPKDVHNHCLTSKIHFSQERYTESINSLTRALTLDPEHAHSYTDRAQCYDKLEMYDKAVQDIRSAIRFDSANHKLYAASALLNKKAKNWKEAERDLGGAIKANSKRSLYYRQRAIIRYKHLKDYKGADRDSFQFSRLKKEMPADLIRVWALSATQLNNKRLAESLWTKLIVKDEKDGEALKARGEIYHAEKKWDQAADDLRRALQLGSQNLQTYRKALAAHAHSKKINEGKAIAKKCLRKFLNDQSALDALLNFYLLIGDEFNAQIIANRYLKLFPKDPQRHANFARVHLLRKDFQRAAQSISRALKKRPRSADFLIIQAKIQLRLGQVPNAISGLTVALQKRPKDIRALKVRAEAYLMNKQPRLALQDFELAFSVGLETERAFATYITLLNDLNKSRRALQIGKKGIKRHSNSGKIAFPLLISCLTVLQSENDARTKKKLIDQALYYFEISLSSKLYNTSKFDEDPRLRLLRQDPRYQKIKSAYKER